MCVCTNQVTARIKLLSDWSVYIPSALQGQELAIFIYAFLVEGVVWKSVHVKLELTYNITVCNVLK